MAALIGRTVSAWDGLALHVHDWGPVGDAPALLCLPGLVRTGADFADLAGRYGAGRYGAGRYGAGRRVVSLDYAGRGASGRAASVERYAPEACLRDVLDVCSALHLHRAIVIGTSLGGLLAMALGVARPGMLAGVVLNDIGPEVGSAGLDIVRHHVADDPALPGLAEAAAHLRARLADLSLSGETEWQRFAGLTYAQGPDGRFHPRWDTRIAALVGRKVPPLWPLFHTLAGVKLLLVHGGRSTILTTATVDRMRAARPDMGYAVVPDSGHAPTLNEPAVVAALDGFLAA